MITVSNKENCTGCSACASVCPNVCIKMQEDQEGFWYPAVNVSECVQCGLCVRTCPVLQKQGLQAEERTLDIKAYAAYNKAGSVRLESSSGGIFPLLAEEIVNAGGVVFGASFDEDFNVIHDYAETYDEISKFMGSKYVQSKIGNSYQLVRDALNQDRMVLFTGTPCQISGLRYFLGREYNNLLCQDVICLGVPNPKAWRKYVAFREELAGSTTCNVSFRRKDKGWTRYSVFFQFANNTSYQRCHYRDEYMTAFLRAISIRPSCYVCRFRGIRRESDITFGDFWGIHNVFPEMDDDKGISLVLVHSGKGQEIFDRVRHRMLYRFVNVNDAVLYNPSTVKSVSKHPFREQFFECLSNERFDVLVRRFCRDQLGTRIVHTVALIIRLARTIVRKAKGL